MQDFGLWGYRLAVKRFNREFFGDPKKANARSEKGRQPLFPPQHTEARSANGAPTNEEMIGLGQLAPFSVEKLLQHAARSQDNPFQWEFCGISSAATKILYFSFGFGRGEFF
jgi:hypothetical protein